MTTKNAGEIVIDEVVIAEQVEALKNHIDVDEVSQGGFFAVRVDSWMTRPRRSVALGTRERWDIYRRAFQILQQPSWSKDDEEFLVRFWNLYHLDTQECDMFGNFFTQVPADRVVFRESLEREETLDEVLERNASGRGERIRRRRIGF